MRTKISAASPQRSRNWQDIDDLYRHLLCWHYDRQNTRKARQLAGRLKRHLLATSSDEHTILGEGAWALVLECLGDLPGAIKHREKEIQLIKRLLQISSKSPNPKVILKYYDYSDLSDRLDLLAILYHDTGNLDQALKILRQSKQICEKHEIAFDGKNLWKDYLAETNGALRQSHRNSQKKAV
ncbi:MAG TPA: hypothetical protein VGX70_23510 [Gemmataceae bacterium]|jgi:tetratricopeptide (TPR) repeat protein|nr:hypothetical protein [Gemmataceae bacterium]